MLSKNRAIKKRIIKYDLVELFLHLETLILFQETFPLTMIPLQNDSQSIDDWRFIYNQSWIHYVVTVLEQCQDCMCRKCFQLAINGKMLLFIILFVKSLLLYFRINMINVTHLALGSYSGLDRGLSHSADRKGSAPG